MNKSDQINELAAALVLAQPMVEGAKKDSFNPGYKSKYADLESVWDAVRPALQAHNLAVAQFPDQTSEGLPALTTILIHKSGQWISGTYPLISSKNDPQGFMSALTYGRRGGLSSVMGVLAEDDDGNAASKPPKPSSTPAPLNQTTPEFEPKDNPLRGFKQQADGMLVAQKKTMRDWVAGAPDEVRALRGAEVGKWLNGNSAALVKLRALDEAKHRDLINLCQQREALT